MEKYRKIAGKCLAAVLSAAMALSLAACAGGTGSSESQSQSAKQEAAAEKPAQATGEKIVKCGSNRNSKYPESPPDGRRGDQ